MPTLVLIAVPEGTSAQIEITLRPIAKARPREQIVVTTGYDSESLETRKTVAA